jgi:hypothetical protein
MASASDGQTTPGKEPLPTVRSFVTGALVLTVGLAWSNAVQATIDHVYPQPAHSAIGQLIYAGALTGASLVALEAINMRAEDVARVMHRPPPTTTTESYRTHQRQETQPPSTGTSNTGPETAPAPPLSKRSAFRRRLARKLLKE